MIQDHSDHGASKEPRNPLWARIPRFLWCPMIQVILDHWSWSGSSQTNATIFIKICERQLNEKNVLSTRCRQSVLSFSRGSRGTDLFTPKNLTISKTKKNSSITGLGLAFLLGLQTPVFPLFREQSFFIVSLFWKLSLYRWIHNQVSEFYKRKEPWAVLYTTPPKTTGKYFEFIWTKTTSFRQTSKTAGK